jgi:electron transfer flavoprotein beta subunit
VKIAVCVKQILDPEIAPSVFKIDETTNTVVPVAGMAPVMSPFDEQAIEAALRIKDKLPTTVITLLTIGPSSAREVLKHGLSMGADEAIQLTDDALLSIDSYVTAAMLCRAVQKAGTFDLILTGRQSADLDAGIVGCGLAELLGIPAITFAKEIQTDGRSVTVERVLESGIEVVDSSLPALVTVSNELGAARKPSLRETMRAARKPITTWSFSELAGDRIDSKIEIIHLYIPKKEKRCVFIDGSSPEDIAATLFERLHAAELI